MDKYEIDIIKKCAVKMRLRVCDNDTEFDGIVFVSSEVGDSLRELIPYDPIHNDDQCFAMIREFPSAFINALRDEEQRELRNFNLAACAAIAKLP